MTFINNPKCSVRDQVGPQFVVRIARFFLINPILAPQRKFRLNFEMGSKKKGEYRSNAGRWSFQDFDEIIEGIKVFRAALSSK